MEAAALKTIDNFPQEDVSPKGPAAYFTINGPRVEVEWDGDIFVVGSHGDMVDIDGNALPSDRFYVRAPQGFGYSDLNLPAISVIKPATSTEKLTPTAVLAQQSAETPAKGSAQVRLSPDQLNATATPTERIPLGTRIGDLVSDVLNGDFRKVGAKLHKTWKIGRAWALAEYGERNGGIGQVRKGWTADAAPPATPRTGLLVKPTAPMPIPEPAPAAEKVIDSASASATPFKRRKLLLVIPPGCEAKVTLRPTGHVYYPQGLASGSTNGYILVPTLLNEVPGGKSETRISYTKRSADAGPHSSLAVFIETQLPVQPDHRENSSQKDAKAQPAKKALQLIPKQ